MTTKLDAIAFQFLKTFATAEFYLKEHGFVVPKRNGHFEIDWDRYANEIVGQDFLNKLGEDSCCAEYILEKPPMKQILDSNNKVIWQEVCNENKSVQNLFGHICRVRNNLFHGAKFNGTWFKPERSEKLLKYSLSVINKFHPKSS